MRKGRKILRTVDWEGGPGDDDDNEGRQAVPAWIERMSPWSRARYLSNGD